MVSSALDGHYDLNLVMALESDSQFTGFVLYIMFSLSVFVSVVVIVAVLSYLIFISTAEFFRSSGFNVMNRYASNT